MIEGKVTEALDPIVEIGLKAGEIISTIEAIVDTGFSGYLCLSERWVDKLDMTFSFVERYEMANGEIVPKDVFRGAILFNDGEREVDLILTASEDTLIGASLFKDYKVVVDYPKCLVHIE
ncbi:MAG: hypothetical protein NUV45_14790 [Tepidanaerobacteraceae bacterium]|jgi:clan AA aspartic protease|nr:hypothetical protein [Tepidanaerobacteraceae bacterium]